MKVIAWEFLSICNFYCLTYTPERIGTLKNIYLGGGFYGKFQNKNHLANNSLNNWLQAISSDNQLLASFEFLLVSIKLQVVFFSFPISLIILT